MANYLASPNGNDSNYRSINVNTSDIFNNNNNINNYNNISNNSINNNIWSHSVPQSMPWITAQHHLNPTSNNAFLLSSTSSSPSPFPPSSSSSIMRFTAGPNISPGNLLLLPLHLCTFFKTSLLSSYFLSQTSDTFT